jgi:hypothetical protein
MDYALGFLNINAAGSESLKINNVRNGGYLLVFSLE